MANVISASELKQKIDGKEDFVLVDALGENSYSMRHIPGAVNVQNNPEFIKQFEEMVDAPKDIEIITYCSSATCTASVQAAEKLEEAGYTNVGHYKDGIAGWQDAGFEFE